MRSITSQRQLKRTLSQIDGNLEWERDMAAEAATLYLEHCFRKMARHFHRHRFGCNFNLGMDAIHVVPAFRGCTSVKAAVGLMYRRAYWPGIRKLHLLTLELEKIAWHINSRYDRQLAISPVEPEDKPPVNTASIDKEEQRKLVADALRRAWQEDNERRERIRRARTCDLSG